METFKSLNITLHKLVSSADAAVCFSKPSPDKWSIAEIIEHVNISDKGAYLAMLKPGPIPTEAALNESKLRIASMLGGAAGAWQKSERGATGCAGPAHGKCSETGGRRGSPQRCHRWSLRQP
jgi:hypothetical protein